MTAWIKTTAVFLQPFELPSFNETLPPGEYEIESELVEPFDHIEPDTLASSVLLRLHPRASHPGLNRTLTVPLAEFESAVAKDKLTGKALTDFFLEEMLADPMTHLVMKADGVGEAELRDLYSVRPLQRHNCPGITSHPKESSVSKETSVIGPRYGSWRPGIGE